MTHKRSMQYQALKRYAANLNKQIKDLDRALASCDGEAYRGCWLDSATNSAGKRYTRLRWFREASSKKKGCRTLDEKEIAIAQQAIALWQERDRLSAELRQTQRQIEAIELQAAALGLEI